MSMRQLKIINSITNRESLSLKKYLQEISKVAVISPEEEVRLIRLIKRGDKKALDRLIKANLRFVVSVAKQYQGRGLSLSDLINEGNLGLIKAAERFDDTRGFKFISFAVWWIRQHILHALADKASMIRIPLNKVTLRSRIRKMHTMLEQQLERTPSAEEIAEALNIDIEEINQSLDHKEFHVSLDTPFSEEEETSLLDTYENINAEKSDAKLCHNDSLKQELDRALSQLTSKQQQTICYYFGIGMDHPMSLDDIAQRLEVTTERVRQIKDKAIGKLRTMQNKNVLRSFLSV